MKLIDIINEDKNEKLKKKVNNVYRAFKIGTFTVLKGGPCKVKYVLPNEYQYNYDNVIGTDNPPIKIDMRDVKFYTAQKNGELYEIKYLSLSEMIDYSLKIREKFERFNVDLSIMGRH